MSKFGDAHSTLESSFAGSETTATPIAGNEAKDLILLKLNQIVNGIPGLERHDSYHRLGIEMNITLSAYPADVPTPKKEIQFNIDSKDVVEGKFKEHFERIKYYETVREELLARLEEVNEVLDSTNPVFAAEVDMQAGNEPDRLRIENGLKIPVVQQIGNRKAEKFVETNGFSFGGNK